MDYKNFSENIRSSGYDLLKLDIVYPQVDCRCWTCLINQKTDSVLVTYAINREFLGDMKFDVFSSNKIMTNIDPSDIFTVIDTLTTTSNHVE